MAYFEVHYTRGNDELMEVIESDAFEHVQNHVEYTHQENYGRHYGPYRVRPASEETVLSFLASNLKIQNAYGH